MISETKIDRLHQMELLDWPRANYESVVAIDVHPDFFIDNYGIKFYKTAGQLGEVLTAYLKYDVSYFQLMFFCLEPAAGIYINIDKDNTSTKVSVVSELLTLFCLSESKVTWRRELI